MAELFPWLLLAILLLLYALFVLNRRYREVSRFAQMQLAELEVLGGAGRAIVQAKLDIDALCELIAQEAGKVIDTRTFQIGLFEGDKYQILYWSVDGERRLPQSYDISDNPGIVGWVRRSRQTLTIGDYEKELAQLPAKPRYVSDSPPRSGVFIPLLSGNVTLGIMAAQSHEPHRFSTSDVRRLSILANQAAAAISHAYLYAQARRRAAQLELVGQIARRVNAVQDLDELMHSVVHLTRETFGFHPVGILGIDEATNEAVLYATTLPRIKPGEVRIPAGRGLIGTAVARCETIVSNNTIRDELFVAAPENSPFAQPLPTQAEMAIPLIADQRLLGVLDVQSEQPEVFGPADRSVLEALAAQVATAIDKTRQWVAQQEQAWLTTAELEVAEALSQSDSLEELLQALCRLTPLLVGVSTCVVLMWEDEIGHYHAAEASGMPVAEEAQFRQTTLELGDWSPLDAVHVGREKLITRHAPPWSAGASPEDNVWALYPMIAHGMHLGVMVLTRAKSGAEPATEEALLTSRQEELLGNILQEAAQAVAGELLHRAQQEEAWVNTALLQVAEAVNSLIDLDEILGAIVRFVPLLIGVEKSIILIWDEATHTYHAGPSHGLSEMGRGLLESFEISEVEFPSAQSVEEGRLSGAPYQAMQLPGWLRTVLETDLAYFFPLFARASLVGALLVTPPAGELPLTGRRLSILTGIGQQAAIAVVNDQLYKEAAERSRLEQELDVARSIQASFIPPGNPALPGCSVASYWRAARQVGGDFYDFYDLGRNHWGVLVADVADKGVPAALFMALSRTILRTIALQRDNPARALERANQIIWNDTTSDLFVTVFYAVWNADEEVLTFANAGHNPPVLLRADHPPTLLSGAGMALGVLENIEVEARKIHFRAGDVLICYTDGVSEAANEDRDEFGVERLMASVRVADARGAEDIIGQITAAIRDFSGDTPQSDDITLVVVKREGEQAEQG